MRVDLAVSPGTRDGSAPPGYASCESIARSPEPTTTEAMRSTRPHEPRSLLVNVRHWRGLRRMGRSNYALFFSGVWSGAVALMFGVNAYLLRDRLWDGPGPVIFLVVAALGPFLGLLFWELYEGAYQRALGGSEGERRVPSSRGAMPSQDADR